MSRDDERAALVKDEVIRGKRYLHAGMQRESLGVRVTCIETDLAERRRSYCYLHAIRRNRDAVREGYVWRNGGVGRCSVGVGVGVGVLRDGDVAGPAEWQGKERLGDGERLSQYAWQAPRKAVVVREVEGRRAREGERVRSDKLRSGERAHPVRAVRGVPGERELLDRAAVSCVVHDEEVGIGFAGFRDVDVEPEGMEVVLLRVPLQGDSPRLRANRAHVVKPERPSGVGVS